jgi:hypothetical protein
MLAKTVMPGTAVWVWSAPAGLTLTNPTWWINQTLSMTSSINCPRPSRRAVADQGNQPLGRHIFRRLETVASRAFTGTILGSSNRHLCSSDSMSVAGVWAPSLSGISGYWTGLVVSIPARVTIAGKSFSRSTLEFSGVDTTRRLMQI